MEEGKRGGMKNGGMKEDNDDGWPHGTRRKNEEQWKND